MYEAGIFVFGTKLFPERSRDGISSLPLELSWQIFKYLDDVTLRNASFVCITWKRIIHSNKSLKRRLNHFETVLKVGSENLAKYHRRNRKILKKLDKKNYLSIGESKVEWTREMIIKTKRPGENIVVRTKRYKLF
ncbi:hypothetical protein KGM_201078 [Danaus plexippus plexippus]|uniref:Uncharacterized protein n=1 Tax=Danaus plexippus plexippus TaxID=278856 RepID=A0A212EYW6_DANPL|nr:hypothetical protein KGM_201078 [Danaus plexippus plexippus]